MKKKILSGIAAGLFFVLTACGGATSGATSDITPPDDVQEPNTNTEYASEIPTYDDCEKEFFIMAFGEPRNLTYETFKDAADLGVTYMQIDPWFNGTSWQHPEILQKAVELCDDVGMKALIMMARHDNGNAFQSYKDYETKIIENGNGKYGEDFKFTDWRGFGGVIFDEPVSPAYPFFQEDYAKYKVDYPDSLYIINMMFHDTVYTDIDLMYKDYVDEVLGDFEDDTRILSIDVYPYKIIEGVNKLGEKAAIRTEIASHYAKEVNAKFYTYVQTMATADDSRCPDCVEDARWQVGFNLAFGSVAIELFTYSYFASDGESFSGTCCISVTGEKEETYYHWKQVFDELHNWQKVYLSYDYVGTMVVDTDAVSPNADDLKKLVYTLDGHERIKSVSAQRDLLIGAFKDKDGYDGFLFNSYTDPYYKKYNKIHVEFNDTSRVLCYINGEERMVDAVGGVFEYEMEAGDIVFAIPLK